jgi:DNA polymerase-4
VRLLGVGVSGLADWIQDDLFDGLLPGDADPTGDAATPDADGLHPDSGDPVLLAVDAFDRHGRHSGEWLPGADVVHATHGRGWVWGAGRGRVTVRFEAAATPSGPVRTFAADDPALEAVGPEPVAGVAERAPPGVGGVG